jgi:uncharacterized membrane protein YhaH (DUF805 family)
MFGTLWGLLGEAASQVKNGVSQPSALFNEIYWVSVIPLYWPIFALLVKRLHDFGQGWGFVWIRGTRGSNEYGPAPLSRSRLQKA